MLRILGVGHHFKLSQTPIQSHSEWGLLVIGECKQGKCKDSCSYSPCRFNKIPYEIYYNQETNFNFVAGGGVVLMRGDVLA